MATTGPERTMVAKIAAHARWANESDPQAATAKARRGFMRRFELEVDPDGTLPAEERTRRAAHAMKAHMTRLALAREQKRRERRLAAKPEPATPRRRPAAPPADGLQPVA